MMQICKPWADERRTIRKIGSIRRKVMSARYVWQIRMGMIDLKASSKQLAECWSSATSVLMSASWIFFTSVTQWTTRKGAFTQISSHGKSSTAGSAIGSWAQNLVNWLSPSYIFLINHTSVCRTMMDLFVLDAMPVSAASQNVLSTDIVVEHPELWSEVRFRILTGSLCYEMSVIALAIYSLWSAISRSCCLPLRHHWSYLSAG